MTAPTFAAFAAEVLDQRAEEGIRGISSERNRFALHGPLMPLAASNDEAPDTQRDVTTWAEAEAS